MFRYPIVPHRTHETCSAEFMYYVDMGWVGCLCMLVHGDGPSSFLFETEMVGLSLLVCLHGFLWYVGSFCFDSAKAAEKGLSLTWAFAAFSTL